MSKIIFKHADYRIEQIRPAVFSMIDTFAGDRISRGVSVMIKPNFLVPAKPEAAVTTHPLIVRAAAEYCLEKGARVRISDSPALGSFERVLKTGGYAAALAGLDIACKPFNRVEKIDIGPPFGRIAMAAAPLRADVVINLAKLKTHSQMGLTLGVKNLFGTVVGLEKPQWHLRAGANRELFARLLVQICRAVNPAVTIVDGILAMEGDGPGRSGTPRRIGVLAGGQDAMLVDAAICRMLGMEEADLPTIAAAEALGIQPGSLEIEGRIPSVEGFVLPASPSAGAGPRRIRKLMRRHVIQRPVVDKQACIGCGECWRMCPAKVITPEDKKPVFNYDDCIRCYCCVEVCPHGALRAVDPPMGLFYRRLLELTRRVKQRYSRIRERT